MTIEERRTTMSPDSTVMRNFNGLPVSLTLGSYSNTQQYLFEIYERIRGLNYEDMEIVKVF